MMAKYDKQKMQEWAHRVAVYHWHKAISIFGKGIGKMPMVEMNARLTATAGRAFLEHDKIDLSCFLMNRHYQNFRDVIIPHELCHFIAWRLYKDNGHGPAWKYCMQEMGLQPDRLHDMPTKHQLSNRNN